MFKVDVFVPALDPVSSAQIRRASVIAVDATDSTITLRVASAEDTIAQKLLWFRRGDETSERQWLDALGVIAVQGDRLDLVYLRQTAEALAVRALLERAVAESASRPPGS
jgi:hypothetical protein